MICHVESTKIGRLCMRQIQQLAGRRAVALLRRAKVPFCAPLFSFAPFFLCMFALFERCDIRQNTWATYYERSAEATYAYFEPIQIRIDSTQRCLLWSETLLSTKCKKSIWLEIASTCMMASCGSAACKSSFLRTVLFVCVCFCLRLFFPQSAKRHICIYVRELF